MVGKITQLPINRDTYIDRSIADVPLEEVPPYGLFLIAFNNRKKQKNGLQHYEAYGSLYPSGHVHIDTLYLQVHDFVSLRQMIDFLENYGDCHVHWLRGE